MSVEIEVQSSTSGVENTLRRLSAKFRGLNKEVANVGVSANKIGKVKVDTKPAVAELRRLNSQFETTRNNVTRTANSIVRNFQRIAAAGAFLFGSNAARRQLNSSSDAMTELGNRIALVTGRTKELNRVQSELFSISKRTRSDVEGAAEIFNRFGIALGDAGVSTETLLRVTESVQKAATISGSSAESANAAIIQLGQGLAAGQLRGQELNSVMEQIPRLARAIADEAGYSMGELRQAAQDGLLTPQLVLDAMINQASALDQEFGSVNKTLKGTGVVFGNSFQRTIARLDSGLGFTAASIRGMERMTDLLDDNQDQVERLGFNFRIHVLHTLRDAALIAEGLGSVFGAIGGRLLKIIPAVILPMRTITDDLNRMFINVFLSMRAAAGRTALDIRADLLSLVDDSIIEAFTRIFQADNAFELRDGLFELSTAIDTLGLRWYNIGNRIEVVLRKLNIEMLRWGIYLGLIDQRLIRLRYKSIERISIAFTLASAAAKNFFTNFRFSQAFVSIIVGLVTVVQQVKRTFEAFINDIANATGLRPITNTFELFAAGIKDIFYRLYMYVVGNSVWPDMINEMYDWAKTGLLRIPSLFQRLSQQVGGVLTKTLSAVHDFAADAVQAFRGAYDDISTNRLDGLVNQLNQLKNFMITTFVQGFGQVWKAVHSLGEDATAGMATLMLSAIVGVFSSKKAKGLLGLSALAFSAQTIGAVLPKVSKELIDSNFIGDMVRPIGYAVGEILANIIKNIPLIIDLFAEAGEALVEGFFSAFGSFGEFVGSAISKLTFGIADSIVGAAAFSLLFVKFATLKKVALDTWMAISGLSVFGGAGATGFFGQKDKSGSAVNSPGIISQMLYGKGGSPVAILGSLGLVFGLLSGQLNFIDGFATSFGTLGLISVMLFGLDGTIQGVISGIKKVTNALSLLFLGKTLNQTSGAGLITRMLGLGDGKTSFLSNLTATIKTLPGQMAAFMDKAFHPQKILRFRATAVAAINAIIAKATVVNLSDLLISSAGITLARQQIAQFGTFFVSSMAKMKARVAALAGPMGLMGTVMFGRIGRAAVLLGSILGLFSGMAEASTGAVAASLGSGLIDLGLVGGIVFGAAGPRRVKAMIDAAKGWINSFNLSSVVSGIAGSASGIVGRTFGKEGVIGRMIFGTGTTVAGLAARAGAMISGVLSGLGVVVSGAVLGISAAVLSTVGLIGVLLFGEGDSIGEKLSNAGSAIRSFFSRTTKQGREARAELDGMLTFEKVGDIDIDLKAELKKANLSFATDGQLTDIRKAIVSANKVFERNSSVFQEEGALSRAEQRETTAAVQMVERALQKVPEQTPEKISSNVDRLVSNIGTQFAARQTANNSASLIDLIPGLGGSGSVDRAMKALRSQTSTPEAASGLIGNLELDVSNDKRFDINKMFGDIVKAGQLLRDETSRDRLSAEQITAMSELLAEIDRKSAGLVSTDIIDRNAAATHLRTLGTELNTMVATLSTELANQTVNAQFVALREEVRTGFSELFPEANILGSEEDFLNLSQATLQSMKTAIDSVAGSSWAGDLTERVLTADEANARRKMVQWFSDMVAAGLGESVQGGEFISQTQWIHDYMQQLGQTELEFIDQSNLDSLDRAQSLLAELVRDSERLRAGAGSQAEAERHTKRLEAAALQIPLMIGSTRDKLKAITDYLDSSADVDSLLMLDPAAIARLIALGKEIAKILAMVDAGNITASVMAPVGDSIVERTKARVGLITGQMNDILDAGRFDRGSFDLGDSGGGGGGSGATWWEDFTSAVSGAGFGLEDAILGQVPNRLMKRLVSAANDYRNAQEMINKSTAGEVEKRRQALELIEKSKATIARTLGEGNVGTALGALEGLGVGLELEDVYKRSGKELQKLIGSAIRLNQLENELLNTSVSQLETKKAQFAEYIKLKEELDNVESDGNDVWDSTKDGISSSFSSVLKGTASLQEGFSSFLDSITSKIIDTFTDSLIEGLLGDSFAEVFDIQGTIDSLLGKGGGAFDGAGEELGSSLVNGASEAAEGIGGLFKSLFSGLGSGGGGGFFGSLIGVIGGLFGLKDGGLVKKFATGGFVSGPGGPRDDMVPAMLSNGEYVINAKATKNWMPVLAAINSGTTPAFANGGIVGVSASTQDKLQSTSGQVQHYTINVTGDISRQTRKEVIQMLPEITTGVNYMNREGTL